MVAGGSGLNKTIIGVMGPGAADPALEAVGEALGRRLAEAGWLVLCGGREAGVMGAVCRGVSQVGGTVIGILPGESPAGASPHVTIPIATGLGSARNNINVLSSTVVIACGMGAGTASEVALALKAGKDVVLLASSPESLAFWSQLAPAQVHLAGDVDEAVGLVRDCLPPD